MRVYQIETPNILKEHLARQFEIYQLIEDLDGDSHWQGTNNSQDMPFSQRPPISSPKGFFFSGQENIFCFDGECFRETIPSPSPFALFGVHSCDLTAIAYQDQFFADDPYYQARKQQALLIGVDCINPCTHGFCHSVEAGPGVDLEYADLILHRLQKNRWLLLASSNKGELAVTGLNLAPANTTALRQRENQLNLCEQQFDDCSYLDQGIEAINNQQVPESIWQQLGLQCLSCSGCTMLCPTCSCYSTRDIYDNHTAIQQRFWDSCLYESFQREASQHNPSIDPGERVRHFWTHKFGKKFVETFDRYGCVGCGRCEQTCPGVIGAHSVMERIKAYAKLDTKRH